VLVPQVLLAEPHHASILAGSWVPRAHPLRRLRLRGSLGASLLALALVSFQQGIALAGVSLYRISVAGMVCSFCTQGIEKRLRAIPGTESVSINLSKRLVELTARPGSNLEPAMIRKAIRDAGYDVKGIEGPLPLEGSAAGSKP
jgi:copper chaperone CopZ